VTMGLGGVGVCRRRCPAAAASTDSSLSMTAARGPMKPEGMSPFDGPHPPDPFLSPQQQLMIELGWLELWHALREESPPDQGCAAEEN
jgi:hypothetical protein